MTTTKKIKDEPAAAPQATAKKGPEKQFRLEDVSASIFPRERNGRVFRSVSFTRSYKDRDGQWKFTKSFDVEDLGKVVTVAQQASEWIHGLTEQDAQ